MPFDCENLISGLNSVLHQKTKYNKFDYGFQLYVVSGAENAILDEMASSGWDSDSSKVCDVVGFQKVLKTAAVKNVSSIIRSDMINTSNFFCNFTRFTKYLLFLVSFAVQVFNPSSNLSPDGFKIKPMLNTCKISLFIVIRKDVCHSEMFKNLWTKNVTSRQNNL